MVHQIIQSKNGIFLQTLIVTVLILIIGISIGYFIEESRANRLVEDYKNFEVTALDLKLQNYYYETMDEQKCDIAIRSNLKFAEDIYNEGLVIEKYEEVEEFSKIINEKKKYVLMKAELWMNSIVLKQKCNSPFHTIVYVYSQKPDSIKRAQQDALSETLRIVKEDKGNAVILIPLAGDLGLDSVSMLLDTFNITSYPSVIIDENKILEGYHTAEQIEMEL